MPLIKIERIVSFTSEDPLHTANNILLNETSKKWKCKTPGEKCASVVLQLDQPYVISGIDIGNEHSAYIEMLVSRLSSPEDFKVLLVMSSFMTPLEARQGQNVNKVRMFKQEDLSEPERSEKWDRVKIVCTQPFNRHVQYGLSFIKLYTNNKNEDSSSQPLIGKFIVRPESPDTISTGSLFARRKKLQEGSSEQTLKAAAAIREATSLAHTVSPAVKHNLKQNVLSTPDKLSNKTDDMNTSKPRNRNELLYSRDEEEKHDKIDKLIEKKNEEKGNDNKLKEKQTDLFSTRKEKKDDNEKYKKKENSNKNTVEVGSRTKKKDKINNRQHESNKRKNDIEVAHRFKKQKKNTARKPFARLLEDVVLVISGIQNPERASLRSMALSMGAKYKTDWDNSCTHLVCAFAGTPKFNQVKGKGKIIKKNWLEDCYNRRRKIPWRKYALDNADKGIESEEEILELDEEYLESPNSESNSDIEMGEKGSDNEDKRQKIKQQKQTFSTDIFQTDTENELVSDNSNNSLKIDHNLKSFFHDKIFYVDKVFEVNMEKKIKQYIMAYKGILLDDIQTAADIVITNNSNYKNLKEIFPNVLYISPDWIWECHNRQDIVPTEDYIFD